MAKIKYSALVTDMRGKLNGSVMSQNRSGSYVRNKKTPNNPQTSFQVAARSRIGILSKKWGTITQDQRSQWIAAVDDWQTTNIFGDTIKPSGQNLFIKINSNILIAGGTAVDAPTVKMGVVPTLDLSAVVDVTGTSIVLTCNPVTVPTGCVAVVEATGPVSAGVKFVKNAFRQLKTLPASSTLSDDLYTDYVARFGSLNVNQRVAFRVSFIRVATGERGLALQTDTLAV